MGMNVEDLALLLSQGNGLVPEKGNITKSGFSLGQHYF